MKTDQEQSDDYEGARLSRKPGRDIFGPLDDHLPEVRIPADVKVDLLRTACSQGLDVSAWVRERIYVALYGPEEIGRLYESRARRVQGMAAGEKPQAARDADHGGSVASIESARAPMNAMQSGSAHEASKPVVLRSAA